MSGKSKNDKCFEQEVQRLQAEAQLQGRPLDATIETQRKWVKNLADPNGKWMPVPKGASNRAFARGNSIKDYRFQTRTPDVTVTRGDSAMALDTKFTQGNGRPDRSNHVSTKTGKTQDQDHAAMNREQGHGENAPNVIDEKTCQQREKPADKKEQKAPQPKEQKAPQQKAPQQQQNPSKPDKTLPTKQTPGAGKLGRALRALEALSEFLQSK